MIGNDDDYAVQHRTPHLQRGSGSVPESYQERPVGVTVVAVALTLAILAGIAISCISMAQLSNDYYYSRSTIDADRAVLWANILLSLPVFVFLAGLFGRGAWARTGLISYLSSNCVFLLISFIVSPSFQWISLLFDVVIIVYMARDDVGDAYANESGTGWGIVGGIGLISAQAILTLVILHPVF